MRVRNVTDVGDTGLRLTFHGVRGSTPCHGPSTHRYGGNTSCVSVSAPNTPPILLDLGTGLRYFGESFVGRHFKGVALVTHLHWDHVQGIPFFQPLLESGNELDVYAPIQEDGRSVRDAIDSIIRPPQFPVDLSLFSGAFRFHDLGECSFSIGEVKVTSRFVPHIGPTLGFRLEHEGRSVAYISDHQQAYDGAHDVPVAVKELADGVDVLIHDSQYTPEEFTKRFYFGHCTAEFAVTVARECGASKLVLFHHDPVRTDDQLDSVATLGSGALDVVAAREGMVIDI